MKEAQSKNVIVTVADVARLAGVSKATAARVLGGYGTVSDKVRLEVKAAAKALDYRPNELARSMTTGRSGTIGVVVGDIENPFFGSAVRGISDMARSAGFNVVLANSGEDVDVERAAIKTLVAKRVDGLIVSPARAGETEHLKEIGRSGRSLVLLDRAIPALGVDTVTADDRQAAEAVTRLLLARGHRRIAYVTACDTPDHLYREASDIHTASVRERIEGFIHAGRDAGISDMERWVRLGATTPDSIRSLAADLFGNVDMPSAIIASDSLIALELFKLARDSGIAMPDALSLLTFHDATWTAVTTPPVTVVRQPVYELGEAAARMLIERLKGVDAPPRHLVLPTELIERGSIAPPSR
ncbi:LacI family DNA-binding transcriptional regulator [Allorhizobium taibaishanense]|uniref:LacI family transcriptional regulator n=1 Tax=Allorhizobium taibaishanense TaxID=887144 RepID=A0A1Q9A796_9HYPH|nr:LacI family DNA-binding transcriptional regulator [Allorhizobium taibaishanense]MBB4008390.1 LacI family transcriptional regulator [Allorhizobium taibaishanense]OLP50436.1 LacI family transcriptional regulator [Allorhizobium taibaishanense]